MGFKLALFNVADYTGASRFSSLGLAYLASYLRKYSSVREIHILEKNVLAKLKKIRPNAVGIFSVTQTFNEASLVAGIIKKELNNIPVIIGGYHISALPYNLSRDFDVGVLGEGEETLRELMEVVSKHGFRSDFISRINGIVFHRGGSVEVTDKRKFIENIDSIPFPARDLLPKTPFPGIITSRGCPYKCIFCSSANFWGNPRYHSCDYVVDEMTQLIRVNRAVHISIWDDLFIANLPRLEKIDSLMAKKRINKKVSLGCALRSNLVNPKLCALLKSMNVKRVSIGFESGSQKILDSLKCSSVTVEQHIKAVELCKSAGFHISGTFMVGSPDETEEDLLNTLSLVKKLKLHGGGSLSLTVPLPGTSLWEYAKQKKLVGEAIDYSRIGIMSTDFSDPDGFKGILLTDKISRTAFFRVAQEIQRETNKYYIRGLFQKMSFSLVNIRFVLARPREVLGILRFIIRSLLRRAKVMERYQFYYKKSN
ncbi:MAG: radical SAM protein [Candidatus Omnitrophota bacterium]